MRDNASVNSTEIFSKTAHKPFIRLVQTISMYVCVTGVFVEDIFCYIVSRSLYDFAELIKCSLTTLLRICTQVKG